jgi:hypothetical protein
MLTNLSRDLQFASQLPNEVHAQILPSDETHL